VSKLALIVGDWKGEGWMMGQDGQKHLRAETFLYPNGNNQI